MGWGSSGSRSDQCNSFLPTDVWLERAPTMHYILSTVWFILFFAFVTAANDEGQREGHDGRYPLIVDRVADNFFLSFFSLPTTIPLTQ